MSFEWDPAKAVANFRKHGVRFTETIPALSDQYAITSLDDNSDLDEERFISLGASEKNRILVTVFCYRKNNIRIISARLADHQERKQYEENR